MACVRALGGDEGLSEISAMTFNEGWRILVTGECPQALSYAAADFERLVWIKGEFDSSQPSSSSPSRP